MHTKKKLHAYHISFGVTISFGGMHRRITWVDQRPRNETATKATIAQLSHLDARDAVISICWYSVLSVCLYSNVSVTSRCLKRCQTQVPVLWFARG